MKELSLFVLLNSNVNLFLIVNLPTYASFRNGYVHNYLKSIGNSVCVVIYRCFIFFNYIINFPNLTPCFQVQVTRKKKSVHWKILQLLRNNATYLQVCVSFVNFHEKISILFIGLWTLTISSFNLVYSGDYLALLYRYVLWRGFVAGEKKWLLTCFYYLLFSKTNKFYHRSYHKNEIEPLRWFIR